MINESNGDSQTNSLSRNEINVSHNQINESQEIPMIRNLNIPVSNTKIFKNFNFAFIFIFSLNLFLYIGSLLKFENSDFSICQWPIYFKHQYYRIITHNFFHLGLLHISFNMVFFFSITKDLEKKIGSAYILILVLDSVLLISIIYLIQIAILKYVIITLFKFTEYNFDFYCSLGFSGVLFSLYFITCNFKNVSETNTHFFGLIPVRAKYSPIIYLLLIQVINPNSSLLGHLSGIFSGYLLKNILVFFVIPSKISINSFEEKFEAFLNLLEIKFNYVKIISVSSEFQELELKELNRDIYDLCCIKYFVNLIKNREENLNPNTYKRKTSIKYNQRNNINVEVV